MSVRYVHRNFARNTRDSENVLYAIVYHQKGQDATLPYWQMAYPHAYSRDVAERLKSKLSFDPGFVVRLQKRRIV